LQRSRRAVEWGFDLVTISNDVHLLAAAAHASVQAFRTGQDFDSVP
jgi:4-hydroxy-2-oxoheptanedioate aldolase